jgi:hypothetical protein
MYQRRAVAVFGVMHTPFSIDVAKSLTPGDSWWDRPPRRSLIKTAVVAFTRLAQLVIGR